jgi:gamma-glutamyl-gamma-aminobutyrate hydrolase PuuD
MKDKILVLNGFSYGEALLGLGEMTGNTTEFVDNPDEYKLVLFTGGEDVDPSLYKETSPNGVCRSNPKRDRAEKMIFQTALEHDIPMAGICRGTQFLTVMAGGRLIHHLDNHAGAHHDIGTQKDDIIIRVNSLHHQMAIPSKDGYIIGWSTNKLSADYVGDKDKVIKWKGPEVEAVILPNIKACGVQWHPETLTKTSPGYIFFYNMVAHLLHNDMDDFVKIYTGIHPEQLRGRNGGNGDE